MNSAARIDAATPEDDLQKTTLRILFAVSFCHFLNDTIQSLIPALYPLFKESFALSFTQIGLITLTFQMVASILQPVVGYAMDRKPRPYSLAAGVGFTFVGLVLLAWAPNYPLLLVASALVGLGSAVFHPEASRMARAASGGKHGFAQSLFQVGGNAGSSVGPLLAVLIVSQGRLLWVVPLVLISLAVLFWVGRWYEGHLESLRARPRKAAQASGHTLSRGRVAGAVAVLLLLIFSKYFYLASIGSYYTFYLMHRFGVSVGQAQFYLFIFLFSVAAGTLAGGPLGDRFGRKPVIWFSILGTAPFSLLLPHVSLFWTCGLSIVIGLILASAFSAILVYAQELLPGKVGMVAGLFFGFAFGMGGIGSAVLGWLADQSGITFVYQLCAYLPLIGLLTLFLPNLEPQRGR